MKDKEFKLLIADSKTSLGDIMKAGWAIESNGQNFYFRNKETMRVVPIPQWVKESISKACDNTYRETQRVIREAMGIP